MRPALKALAVIGGGIVLMHALFYALGEPEEKAPAVPVTVPGKAVVNDSSPVEAMKHLVLAYADDPTTCPDCNVTVTAYRADKPSAGGVCPKCGNIVERQPYTRTDVLYGDEEVVFEEVFRNGEGEWTPTGKAMRLQRPWRRK